MELVCMEGRDTVRAMDDPKLWDDPRVVLRLLDLEKGYVVTENYFNSLQTELNPNMRRICLSWLMEVCETEHCEDVSFPLAANLMDRYLSKLKIAKCKLQLLSCVCLMLATKLRQSNPVSSRLLAAYTDDTYTVKDILTWETHVLNTLQWNLASVTPFDYLEPIMHRMNIPKGTECIVTNHAKTFQQLCVLEFEFVSWPASLLAVSTIGAAIKGLININNVWPEVKNLAKIFNDITNIEEETIENCITYMEKFVDKCINKAKKKQAESLETTEARALKMEGISDEQPDTPPNARDVQF